MTADRPYCYSPYAYKRRRTRSVAVGENADGPVAVGADNPIRVQSMTTTNTLDTTATVDQIVRLVDCGCEMVRVTAPKVKDARNLKEIRNALTRRGVRVPLVADIHFLPSAAMESADHVDKVRVNPGNFADRKVFRLREYTDSEYAEELERIEEIFKPLVLKCREYGRAMRIGTNHGSLSDRVMSRYGDSPLGMVESALEFVRICETYDYRDIILSMKASNPSVMVEANRLLVARMDELDMDYPVHIGVTEAGDGEDGRIKSAIGIGSLLEDGIGDTIRVSLTEEPEKEIPVCYELIRKLPGAPTSETDAAAVLSTVPRALNPYSFERRVCDAISVGPILCGKSETIRVEIALPNGIYDGSGAELITSIVARPRFRGDTDPQTVDGHAGAEILSVPLHTPEDLENLRSLKSTAQAAGIGVAWAADIELTPRLAQESVGLVDKLNVASPSPGSDWPESAVRTLSDVSSSSGIVLQWNIDLESGDRCPWIGEETENRDDRFDRAWRLVRHMHHLAGDAHCILGLSGPDLVYLARYLVDRMGRESISWPILLKPATQGESPALLPCSVDLGSLLCDGIGDLVQLASDDSPRDNLRLVYNILQASGRRITKTEFISCPSCGRTLFDLQSTTERIKSKTGHLKDVRIAIMGCIVNGPGEMADADFGYVGAGTSRISLYLGKECVERDIPEIEADERLIALIKSHGRWIDPVPVQTAEALHA